MVGIQGLSAPAPSVDSRYVIEPMAPSVGIPSDHPLPLKNKVASSIFSESISPVSD